jgi:hypothetical protein
MRRLICLGLLQDALLQDRQALLLGRSSRGVVQLRGRGAGAGAVDKAEGVSKPISIDQVMVAAKSASVSPGKPMMKSEDRLISGRIRAQRGDLRLVLQRRVAALHRARMRSEPLCTGRCRWLTSCGISA